MKKVILCLAALALLCLSSAEANPPNVITLPTGLYEHTVDDDDPMTEDPWLLDAEVVEAPIGPPEYEGPTGLVWRDPMQNPDEDIWFGDPDPITGVYSTGTPTHPPQLPQPFHELIYFDDGTYDLYYDGEPIAHGKWRPKGA